MSLHRICYTERNAAGEVLRRSTRYVERQHDRGRQVRDLPAPMPLPLPPEPLRDEVADVARRVGELSQRLAAVERRPPPETPASTPDMAEIARMVREAVAGFDQRIGRIEAALAALGEAAEAAAARK